MTKEKTWDIVAEPIIIIDNDDPALIYVNSQFTLLDCSDCSDCSDNCFCGWGG